MTDTTFKVPTNPKWGHVSTAIDDVVLVAAALDLTVEFDWRGDAVIVPPNAIPNEVYEDWSKRRNARLDEEKRQAEIARRASLVAMLDEVGVATQAAVTTHKGGHYVLTLVAAREGTGCEWEVEYSRGRNTTTQYWPGGCLNDVLAFIVGDKGKPIEQGPGGPLAF